MDQNRRQYIERVTEKVSDFLKHNKTIIYYTKDRKRHKTGVIVSFTIGNNLYIGWSKCNTHADTFNRMVGLHKAIERAEVINDALLDYACVEIPQSIEYDFIYMFDRAKRYFKQLHS